MRTRTRHPRCRRRAGRPFFGPALVKAAAVGLAAAVGGVGCSSDPAQGYSFRSTYNDEARTVFVPIFDNRSFYPGLEVDLTDAIIKEIQRTTPWVVVQRPSADTTLSGVITGVELRSLSVGRGSGMVLEQAVQLSADFDWRDNRTGKTVVSRRQFRAAETFVPARPSGERLEVGEHAAVQELARLIVSELRAGW